MTGFLKLQHTKNILFAACMALLISCAPAFSARLALVIGNDNYNSITPLSKAANDSIAIAQTLQDVGFTVTRLTNLTRRQMNLSIYKFTSKIQKGDEVLFYYAGHGIAVRNTNYILPTDFPDVRPGGEDLVASEALSINQILNNIQRRGAKTNIIILDACRSNPFPKTNNRSLGSEAGLVRMEPAPGTFILFSAGYRQAALDKLGRNDLDPNSVFTRELLPLLKQPGLSLTSLAKKLRGKVETLAGKINHKQFPAYYDQLRNNYYFIPRTTPAPGENQHNLTPDISLWSMVKDSEKASDYKFYLRRFPKGAFSAIATLKLKNLNKKLQKIKKKKLALLKQNNKQEKQKVIESRDYSGTWTVNFNLNMDTTICSSFSERFRIQDGHVVSGHVKGRIDGSGRFHLTRSCRTYSCKYRLSGAIRGNSARGRINASISHCNGRFTITKN